MFGGLGLKGRQGIPRIDILAVGKEFLHHRIRFGHKLNNDVLGLNNQQQIENILKGHIVCETEMVQKGQHEHDGRLPSIQETLPLNVVPS